MEDIPESLISKTTENVKKKTTYQQPSYWKYAYGLVGEVVEIDPKDVYKFRRIDEFWMDVVKITDESSGNHKYSKLCKLVLSCLLILPHGNSDPERGFSINKHVLQVHGTSLKEDTIVALPLVKDQIIKHNGIMNIKITKDLLKSCQDASKWYKTLLEAQKLENKWKIIRVFEAAAIQKAANEKEGEREELKLCKVDLESLKAVIKVAENVVLEGNKELGQIIQKKPFNQKKLMGLKRKTELQFEVQTVVKKIQKLEQELKK